MIFHFGRGKLARRRYVLSFLTPLAGILSYAGAFAQAPARPAAAASAIASPAQFSKTFQLQEFMPQPAPIALRSTYDSYDLFIPLASRLEVTAAKLHLAFTNSAALLPGRSQLRFLMNGAVVAQLSLSPSQPDVLADISIPVALLKYGFNTLTFDAAQHYTNGCEDPGAPELWTQINTVQSTLDITGRRLPLNPKLADLGELLGPAIGNGQHFLFLTPASPPNTQELRWGAILAEAIGLHLRYTPAYIDVAVAKPAVNPGSNADTPQLDESGITGRDTVLFGTRDELAPFLPPTVQKRITNGFLGIYPLTSDPAHFLLVVSGGKADQVTRAGTALAVMDSPISNAPTALIDRLFPRRDDYFHPNNLLRPAATYRFSDLGFTTKTVKGSAPVRFKLDFTLPPDLYEPESANVRLELDFAYGANLRIDSACSIYLNDKFNQAIRLDNQNGAVLRHYRIYIPLRDFRPGSNTLTFEVAMVPLLTSMGHKCETAQTNNLLFTLFDTSTTIMPPADHYTAQPDLSLFAHTGFPYGNRPYGADTAVRVMGHDRYTVSAAWTLLARLAQIDDHALPQADVDFGDRPSKRHVILVSALPDLNPSLLEGAPINFHGAVSLPYLSRNRAGEQFQSATFPQMLTMLYRRLFGQAAAAPPAPAKQMVGEVTFGRAGIVEAFESPWTRDRTMTLVTAATPEVLSQAVAQLVDTGYWYQLAGTVSIWERGHKAVFSGSTDPVFHVGEVSPANFARYYLSRYPWYWIGALLGLGFLLALALRIWSIRRRQRNLPGATDADV